MLHSKGKEIQNTKEVRKFTTFTVKEYETKLNSYIYI